MARAIPAHRKAEYTTATEFVTPRASLLAGGVHTGRVSNTLLRAPLAVPSIAAGAGNGPKGRAQDARARAAVHGRTVCATRTRREAQGSLVRRMRTKPPRSALDLFGYFLGQCQKVTRSAQPSGSFALGRTNKQSKDQNGLLAASAARPSGHSLRECSLRRPAFAVPLSRE